MAEVSAGEVLTFAWKRILRRAPAAMMAAYGRMGRITATAVFFVAAFNGPLGRQLDERWQGFNPAWAAAIVFAMACYAVLRAHCLELIEHGELMRAAVERERQQREEAEAAQQRAEEHLAKLLDDHAQKTRYRNARRHLAGLARRGRGLLEERPESNRDTVKKWAKDAAHWIAANLEPPFDDTFATLSRAIDNALGVFGSLLGVPPDSQDAADHPVRTAMSDMVAELLKLSKGLQPDQVREKPVKERDALLNRALRGFRS